MKHIHSKIWLYSELITLMIVLPAALYLILPPRLILPFIWLAALYCHLIYRKIEQVPVTIWWNKEALTDANVAPIFKRFLISALALTIVTALFDPTLLFTFVSHRTTLWALIMVLYPVLSVVPQEIIYRSFFFTRYKSLFPHPVAMILASALTFGMGHLVFHNWVAPALCTIGGLYFAQTYQRHRSLALVALEHALYGDFLFTLGLGRYFYHGAVTQMMAQ